jgi:hypothetical protein
MNDISVQVKATQQAAVSASTSGESKPSASLSSAAAAANQLSTTSSNTDPTTSTVVFVEGKEIIAASTLSLTNPSTTETFIGPQKNKPCLQSSRLYLVDSNLTLSKTIVTKMNSYLKEMNIPERPIPTKRVCDLVDNIRKSTITLISLHNTIKKKEKDLQMLKNGPVKGATATKPRSSKGSFHLSSFVFF